jgi:hypothetical protein
MDGSFPVEVESCVQPVSTLPDRGHDASPSISAVVSAKAVETPDSEERSMRRTKVTEVIPCVLFLLKVTIEILYEYRYINPCSKVTNVFDEINGV